MTHEQFEALVGQGIASLPEWVQKKLINVAFLIEERPTKRQCREYGLSDDETLFGLYEGVPLTERGEGGMRMPDTITIFREPILEMYTTEEDIQVCIENTIWHEVAHFFGRDEEWVAHEEIARGKTI